MTAQSKSNGLLGALRKLLPETTVRLIHERSWHSLTFSGVQLCISAVVCDHEAVRISDILSEYPFDLKGQLVADIAVIQVVRGASHSQILIDALVLDD